MSTFLYIVTIDLSRTFVLSTKNILFTKIVKWPLNKRERGRQAQLGRPFSFCLRHEASRMVNMRREVSVIDE